MALILVSLVNDNATESTRMSTIWSLYFRNVVPTRSCCLFELRRRPDNKNSFNSVSNDSLPLFSNEIILYQCKIGYAIINYVIIMYLSWYKCIKQKLSEFSVRFCYQNN